MFYKVLNYKDCFAYCNAMTGCNWFTYSEKRSLCQIFKNCPVLDLQSCHDCTSGPKNCLEAEPKCGIQGECKGNIFEHGEMAFTSDECLRLCNSMPGCGWFTFYKEIFQCVLFETCSIAFCQNCVSGETRCINWKPIKGNCFYYF